jgi:magnesium and cobalt transporter
MTYSEGTTAEPESADSPGSKEVERESSRGSLIESIRGWVRTSFRKSPESLKEALEEVMEEHEEEAAREANSEERVLLQNILHFGELEVEDVMIHRADVVAVPHTIKLQSLKEKIQQHGHSRMPVFHENLDRIIGLVHSKDLLGYLGAEDEFKLKQILRPMFAVPPSMKVIDLLVKMRSAGTHMALVVDEYGGTDGIVTLEDLFEKIVGDIQDEYDEDEKADQFHWLDTNTAIVDAKIELDELEEKLERALVNDDDDEDYHTLGGLIFDILGHIPHRGEKVRYRGFVFVIEAADPRRIHRVRVIRMDHDA